MTSKLRVLHVEDSTQDVKLLTRFLTRAGYELVSHRVDTAEAMRCALDSQAWDVILCDYSMPHFNALGALALVKEIAPHIPVIIISGTVGEEVAVEAMRAGANDYLMKGNLLRLAPTIDRVLQEAENHRARWRAEQALKISEQELRALFAAMSDVILVFDAEGRHLKVAPSSPEYIYKTAVERIGKTVHEIFPKETADLFFNYIRRALKENRTQRLEYSLPLEGREQWFEGSVSPMSADTVIWIARDITERKQAEETIRQHEGQLAEAQRLAHIGSWNWDLRSNVLIWSDEHYRIFGLQPGEIDLTYESIVANYVHPDDIDQVKSFVANACSTLEPFNFYYRIIRPDGAVRMVQVFGNVVGDEQGNPIRMFGTAQDVTELKRAEEEQARLNAQLESERQRLNNIIASVPGVVWEAWGEPGAQRIDFVSDYIKPMLGYDVKEWLSTPNFWLSIVHPDDRERTSQAAAVSFASGQTSSTLEFRWITKAGKVRWAQSNTAVIRDETGQPLGLRGVTIDITERKRAEEALRVSEEQLRQSQKLEAVGQLAGGMAHDFNNLLTVISGYCDLTLMKLPKAEPARSNIEEIKKAGDRAAALTRQLLAFSRRQVLQPKVLNLNAIVSDLNKMLRRLIGEDIDLLTVFEPSLGKINADPGQIEQVIINLAVNARDAMPQGGTLSFETANVYLDNEYTRAHTTVKPGNYVMFAVSDTGTGMDADTQARMFEPFFTTKGQGKGTGLGLSTVYGIVKQSEGHIWVYSEPNKGTTFKVYLPRVDDVAQVETVPESLTELPRGRETVLLTEDEEAVRRLTKTILESNGYRVLEAASGDEALSLYKQHAGPVDLIVTDVVMPRMSGRELAEKLKSLRPGIKILYVSGYTDDAIVRHGLLDQRMSFLQKPFTPDALLRKVRDVLAQNADE
jgi:two-component system, cell cycle sensor histidine kinase and response regulator CckA